MLLKVEDNPLLPREFNALVDQLFAILGKICYRLNRTPEHGKVSVDPPSIGAGVSTDVEVNVAGLTVGDLVMANCIDALEAGLVPQGARVKTINKLCIRLFNPTAAAIDGAARDWVWAKLD